MRRLFGLLARFGLAGLVNTGIGLSVIAALDLGLHLDPHLANAVGYAGGLASGYVLNRMFVFKSREDVGSTGLKYLVVVAIAFAVNQGVLALAGPLFGPMPLGRLAAQVTAMATYTVLTFIACRVWVFRPQNSAQSELFRLESPQPIEQLGIHRLLRDYARQKEACESDYVQAAADMAVYLPALDALEQDGAPVTWCAWAKGTKPYLPKADFIGLYTSDEENFFVTWADAEAIIGAFTLIYESDPPRYRPPGWPSPAQYKRLQRVRVPF